MLHKMVCVWWRLILRSLRLGKNRVQMFLYKNWRMAKKYLRPYLRLTRKKMLYVSHKSMPWFKKHREYIYQALQVYLKPLGLRRNVPYAARFVLVFSLVLILAFGNILPNISFWLGDKKIETGPKVAHAVGEALSQAHFGWRANNGSEDWWNLDFKNRRKITFDNTPAGENLTNFPMPIKLTADANDEWSAANIDYSKTKDHGFDVRFVDSSGNMLKHEIENWDETSTSTAWVKVPTLTGTSTTDYIYMYYNNTATTTSGAATSSVWSNSYTGVYHLTATSTAARKWDDSSEVTGTLSVTNANNSGVTINATALLGKGVTFGGTDADYMSKATAAFSSPPGTICSVYKSASTLNTQGLASVGGADAAYHGIMLDGGVAGDPDIAETRSGGTSAKATTANGTTVGKWQYVCGTWTTSAQRNAILNAGAPVANTTNLSPTVTGTGIGLLFDGVPGSPANGTIDEVRYSNVARTADWIQAEYRYGFASSTTHEFATEEAFDSTASFLASEDVAITGQSTASTTRLRVMMDETAGVATTTTYQLEYATSTIVGYTACSALSTWYPVDKTSSSTSVTWKMSPTAAFAHRDSSSNFSGSLTDPTGSFTASELLDRAATTSPITLSAGNFTELEWAIQAGADADGDSYCFRVTNADDATNITYAKYPRVSMATSSQTLTQNQFRIYQNADQLTPTTAWDSLAVNESISSSKQRIRTGDFFRLRMNITISASALSASSQAFTLQYAPLPSGTCATLAASAWVNLGSPGHPQTAFRLKDNSFGASQAVTTLLLSASDVAGLYSEVNPSTTNPNSVAVGQDVEYDWPIEYSSSAYSDTTFCFRMVKSSATVLDTYTNYPQVLIAILGGGSEAGGGAPSGAGQQGGGGFGGGSEVFLWGGWMMFANLFMQLFGFMQ